MEQDDHVMTEDGAAMGPCTSTRHSWAPSGGLTAWTGDSRDRPCPCVLTGVTGGRREREGLTWEPEGTGWHPTTERGAPASSPAGARGVAHG